MNILILSWRDIANPLAGGAEISLQEHAKYWHKKGANVTWVSSRYSRAKKEERIDGIFIRRLGSHYTVHLLFIIKYCLRQYRGFDLVIDSFHFLPFFSPIYIRNTRKIAWINEVAGELWFSNLPFPFSWLGYIAEPFFFKFYKNVRFFTSSFSTKSDLLRVGIKSRSIEIIAHGVSLPEKMPTSRKEVVPTVIYASRITKDKGFEDAVKAIKMVMEHDDSVRFWIIGNEEKKGYLEEVLDRTNLNKQNVRYFGFVSEKRKFELLQKSWLLVHPSKKEGWGLNVIEANSVGTVAIGYDVSGLRDSIKHDETGLLSKTKPEDLAKNIEALITDKQRRDELSKNALRWSKKFRWKESCAKSWKSIKSSL